MTSDQTRFPLFFPLYFGMNHRAIFALAILSSLLLSGCLDRGNPVFRAITKSSERESTEAAEKAVGESETLKRLYDVCRSIPFFNSREPKTKSLITRDPNNVLLTLYYAIDGTDFETVFQTTRTQIVAEGWDFLGAESGIWEEQIEFAKDEFWVRIAYGNFGDRNFAISCRNSYSHN